MDSSRWPGSFLVAAFNTPASTAHGFSSGDWVLLLFLLLMLVLTSLASASETALTSVNRLRIRNLAQNGDLRAQQIERLLRQPNSFLTTILMVNSVAVIVASTLATLIAQDISHSWGELASAVILSVVVLVFCEITPKTAAVQAPEKWARVLVRPVYITSRALSPIVFALTYFTNGLVRLLGGQTRRTGPFVTEEELRLLVEVGEEEGVLEEEEKEMIHNVFELGDTTAREVMVPRIDMVTIDADETVDEAVRLILQGGQSRIPVYHESIDNIIGVLYAKDLLRVLATGQRPQSVRSLVRPAYFVPETKRADDLLHELQQQRVHMAIVVDEYGGVAGLVTIEDLVEEIIGDIQDEYDREEVLYEKMSDNEYIVDAKIAIEDFNELLGVALTSEEYDTLGGFVYTRLDKIPSVGDTVYEKDLAFTVLGTKGRRVTKVKVVRGAGEDPAAPSSRTNRADSGVAAPAIVVTRDPPVMVEPAAATPALPPPAPQPDETPAAAPDGVARGTNGEYGAEPDTSTHRAAKSDGSDNREPPDGAEPPWPGAPANNATPPRARSGANGQGEPRGARQRYTVSRHSHSRGASQSRHR